MRLFKLFLGGIGLAFSPSAMADAPPGTPPLTTCSLSGAICATREPAAVIVWRKLPGGKKENLWRTQTRGTNFQVADDGRSLVEIQPWANLVEQDARPGTPILTFHRRGGAAIRVTLGEMIRNAPALPRSVSYRHWARTFGYDGRGHFQVDTVEGRRILFDPRTGRPVPR